VVSIDPDVGAGVPGGRDIDPRAGQVFLERLAVRRGGHNDGGTATVYRIRQVLPHPAGEFFFAAIELHDMTSRAYGEVGSQPPEPAAFRPGGRHAPCALPAGPPRGGSCLPV